MNNTTEQPDGQVPAPAVVDVTQNAAEVAGELVGYEADTEMAAPGVVTVRQNVGTVTGTLIGYRAR